jgi:hypothetical protein
LPLSNQLKFITLSTAVAAWRVAHPSHDPDMRPITDSLEKRLESHDLTVCLLDGNLDWMDQAAIERERAKFARAGQDVDRAGEQSRALVRAM